MKKIIAIIFSMILLISSFSSVNAASQTTYKVKLQSIKMVSNNHVGNEWSKTIKVNGKKLSVGKEVKITATTLKAIAKIIEEEKYPDIGTKTVTLKKGKVNTFNVTVVEDKGRYKGNKAVWQIKIKVY